MASLLVQLSPPGILLCLFCVHHSLALAPSVACLPPSIQQPRAFPHQWYVPSFHFLKSTVLASIGDDRSVGGVQLVKMISHDVFPQHATTTGLVISGFGLSAFFFSTIARTFFPGDTSALLLLLVLTTSLPMLAALFVVRPIPLPSVHLLPKVSQSEDRDPVFNGAAVSSIHSIDAVDTMESESRQPLLGNQRTVNYCAVPESLAVTEVGLANSQSCLEPKELPDIYGVQLLTTPDFYLLVMIVSLCKSVRARARASLSNVLFAVVGVGLMCWFSLYRPRGLDGF